MLHTVASLLSVLLTFAAQWQGEGIEGKTADNNDEERMRGTKGTKWMCEQRAGSGGDQKCGAIRQKWVVGWLGGAMMEHPEGP